MTGNLILFGLLFTSSVVIGRVFCSWVCPGGALGDIVAGARPWRLRRDRVHSIKYLVWAPWLATILLLFSGAGGVSGIDPLYSTVPHDLLDGAVHASGPVGRDRAPPPGAEARRRP